MDERKAKIIVTASYILEAALSNTSNKETEPKLQEKMAIAVRAGLLTKSEKDLVLNSNDFWSPEVTSPNLPDDLKNLQKDAYATVGLDEASDAAPLSAGEYIRKELKIAEDDFLPKGTGKSAPPIGKAFEYLDNLISPKQAVDRAGREDRTR